MYMAHSPCLTVSPCWFPLLPFHLLRTLLAVTGSVHLGLRLLVNWPPLSQPSSQPSPLQIPRTQVTQRLTKTTLRRIRRLLSRRETFWLGGVIDTAESTMNTNFLATVKLNVKNFKVWISTNIQTCYFLWHMYTVCYIRYKIIPVPCNAYLIYQSFTCLFSRNGGF